MERVAAPSKMFPGATWSRKRLTFAALHSWDGLIVASKRPDVIDVPRSEIVYVQTAPVSRMKISRLPFWAP